MPRPSQTQYKFAVWIDCKTEKTLMSSFTRIAKFLHINEPDGDREVQVVLETLQNSNCLVIYDNCNGDMVDTVFDSFFPNDPDPSHVIITTQLPQSKWIVEKMEVAHMTVENYPEAHILQYIFEVLRIQDPTQETLTAAIDIIKEYKSFTLLMSLIPQYIRMEDSTLIEFMTKYRDLFVTMAPLNVAREDIPLKMIIDSLNLKCKMFLRLLSFMNSLAGIQFFTESAFFVEDQLSNTKFSELKKGVSKLRNLSLIEFFDDGQAVKIGHEWIEHYLLRSTTENDIQLIYENWHLLFNGLIHVERAKYEIGDVFTSLLKYVQKDTEHPHVKELFLNTVTDHLVNWTSPKPPQLYVNIIRDLPNISLQQFIIRGVTHNDEDKLRRVLERYRMENIEDHLHVIIASFYYARMLSVKGEFSESLQLLYRCQTYMSRYLDQKHVFCQNVYREYALALYHTGQYQRAIDVLTTCHQMRIKDDTKCYLGLAKFHLNDFIGAWKILKEYIIDTIVLRNRCDLHTISMREGLATLLQCEIMLNTPFPNILHQDAEMQLHQAIHIAQTLYNTHHHVFQRQQIVVNQQTFSIGQFDNEPVQQYTAIEYQGRMIVIYRVAQVSKWCILYTNNFIF